MNSKTIGSSAVPTEGVASGAASVATGDAPLRHGVEGVHTPGPWRFSYCDGDKASEIWPARRVRTRLCEPIAIIPHDDFTEAGERELLANARLIVAAPDLLATLIQAEGIIRCETVSHDGELVHDRILTLLASLGWHP